MKQKLPTHFFHDLRAPLARALTYSKLIEEARPEEAEELHLVLRKSLEELEALLQKAEEENGES